jgi:hypothetical protein
MIQIQLLAGAMGISIQQHSEEEEEASLSQICVFPCCFSGAVDVIHIMWVKMNSTSRDRNHIIPLLPRGTVGNTHAVAFSVSTIGHVQLIIIDTEGPMVAGMVANNHTDIASSVSNVCVFKAANQCMVKHLHGDTDVDWVQCSKCSCWYHCACVGITGNSMPAFTCCASCDDKV